MPSTRSFLLFSPEASGHLPKTYNFQSIVRANFNRRGSLPAVTGAAIAWLRQRGLSVHELAEAFDVQPGHVRTLHHRAVHRSGATVKPLRLMSVRTEEDTVVLRPDQRKRISRLTDRVEKVSAIAASGGALTEAIRQLRNCLQFVGYPASTEIKRLRARILQQIGWCQVHLGEPSAGLPAAEEAAALYRQVRRHSGSWDDLVRIGETTLIASQAALSLLRPDIATKWLKIHERAHADSGEPLNVEFYRQRGTCAVLLGQEEEAVQHYLRAGEVVKDTEEDWWIAHASERPLSVLSADWDLAVRALESIRSAKPSGLEVAIATVWACGAAVTSGGRGANDWSDKVLLDSSLVLSRFEHQRQLAYLIRAGLRLSFSSQHGTGAARLRTDWIRWVLYRSV